MHGRTSVLGFLLAATLLACASGDDGSGTYIDPATVPGGMPGGAAGGTTGGAAGGTTGGAAGGVSGTVSGAAGGASGTVSGGAAGGVSGTVSGGAAAGVSGTLSGGAAGGVSGTLSGGVAGTTGGVGGTTGSTGGTPGATGGTTGGGTPGAGGSFPRADEAVNVGMMGPYQVDKYSTGIDDPAYGNPMIYYPKDAKPPFAAIALALGFVESRSQLEWWGPVLASHGFIAFHADTTTPLDVPQDRCDDQKAMLTKLKAENGRSGSPLMGKVDVTRFGLMGHSMGGGASLRCADQLKNEIKAIAPLQPWEPGLAFPNITAPALIIAAQNDAVAGTSSNAKPHYESIKVTKVYAEVKGADHMVGTTSGSAANRAAQATIALAWMKIYLENDKRYEDYIFGDKRSMVMGSFSSFLVANK